MLPQATRERSRVDSRDSRNLFAFEPRTERPLRGIVTVVADVVLHDETLYLDLARLVGAVDAFPRSGGRNAVVPDQRVGADENLSSVGRVRQGLDVAGHPGVEDDLACYRLHGAKRRSRHFRAVLEDELHLGWIH